MTDHLTRLVKSSHNFGFLAEPAVLPVGQPPLLAGDAAAAELYIYSDPDAAMGKARRFSETLAKQLVQHAGMWLDPKATQASRTKTLAMAGVIPQPVRQLFDMIRIAGNEAVHSYPNDTQRAMAVVEACFELGTWWYRTKTGSPPVHAFALPSPSNARSTGELLESVERQIDALHAAFEASLATAAKTPEPTIRIGPVAPDGYLWQGGSEVTCDSVTYLLHDPVDTMAADDRSWTIMQANARSLDSHARPVWLRGVRTESPSPAAKQLADGLSAQASYLKAGSRRKGLPGLISQYQEGKLRVLVMDSPAGSSWRDMFGDGQPSLDPLVVPMALDVLAGVGDALVELHRNGHAHRMLDAGSIRVTARSRRGVLRDLGLAWWPRLSGEGGQYRAPEQQSLSRGRPGPPTDVYQLAAILQHACAGFTPIAGRAIPLKTILPTFPEQLDTLVIQALDPDPEHRPDIVTFAAGLRRGRRHFSTEAATA